MDEKRKLCFDWGISDYYGWGIYGFNLLLHGQMSNAFQIFLLQNPDFLYPLDPLAYKFISERLQQPNAHVELKSHDIFLTHLSNSNQVNIDNQYRNIGVIFNETNPLPQDEINKLKNFEFIITGSTWNSSVLEQSGIKTKTIMQGVDLDLFRHAQKRHLKDKFVIFSGGKLEYRKGQDLVIKAFSRFAKKHNDVVLITAWRSPWEQGIAQTVNQSNVCEPLVPSDDMGQSISEWISRNGINLNQVICLGPTPNRLMPEVFREVDLAVFPNRCEAGTNLVAMEALAYGITCLISKNTGHLDLIKDQNCFSLSDQKSIHGQGTSDWGESSVEEMEALMEECYQGKIKIDPLKARESMLDHSWEGAINSMLALF